jgi:hypothetical protein
VIRRILVVYVGTAAVILVALALVVLKSGVWLMPNLLDQFAVSQSLTNNALPRPGTHYVYTSYLQPAIFGILGGKSVAAYAMYCALVALAFFTVLVVAFMKTHGLTWKLLGVAAFPVIMVPFYWVGMDGMTLLLALAVSVTLHTRWVWFFGLLLSWQHFEQAIMAFLILALTLVLAGHTPSLRRVALVLCVLLVGKAALIGYFHLVGLHLVVDRTYIVRTRIAEFVTEWRSSWPLILWSLCGAGWILLIATMRRTWPVLVAVLVALLTLLATSDQTRVGSIILFPTLVYWVFLDRRLWRELHWAWIAAALVAHVLLPVVYVWAGIPCRSVRSHTLRQLEAGVDLTRFDWLGPFLDRTTGVCPADMIDEAVRRLSVEDR